MAVGSILSTIGSKSVLLSVDKSTLRFFWFTGSSVALRCRIAMTSLEYKFEDQIFGHQCQTVDP